MEKRDVSLFRNGIRAALDHGQVSMCAQREVLERVGVDLRQPHRRAELGYWVGQPFWNRGYATEAARAVIAFGFEVLGLNRIHASHLTRNPASGRVMPSPGSGSRVPLRQHVIEQERPEDLAEYAILRADMPAFGGSRR